MTPSSKQPQDGSTDTVTEPKAGVTFTPLPDDQHDHVAQNATVPDSELPSERPAESGGQAGLEPTRYGDWEKKGRCTDF